MFLENKYSRWYFSIIEKAKTREISGPIEWHHIVPKSMGGRHTNENYVALTFREHFLVHWLLTKMTTNEQDRRKMLCALSFMRNHKRVGVRVLTGWQYEKARQARIDAMKGRQSPMKGRFGKDNPLYGRKHSAESIAKMTKKKRENGFVMSEEHRKTISNLGKKLVGEKNPFFGKQHSHQTKNKLKNIASNRPKEKCPVCGGLFVKQMLVRWHGDKCKVVSQ